MGSSKGKHSPRGVMGVHEHPQEMVACAHHTHVAPAWPSPYFHTGVGACTIYLYPFLRMVAPVEGRRSGGGVGALKLDVRSSAIQPPPSAFRLHLKFHAPNLHQERLEARP